MKKTIIALILGVAIGVSTTASASALVYWKRGGNTYVCTGTETGVICAETNYRPKYEVAIVRGSIIASYRGKVIFGCDRGYSPASNCDYYGP